MSDGYARYWDKGDWASAPLRETVLHPWSECVFRLTSTTCQAAYQFFLNKGFRPALFPVTCGAISSPIAPGSDSHPVSIELFGQQTYLADSMQFFLELAVRYEECGAFYIMPSFRSDAPDPTHLNQFVHIEAEVPGSIAEILVVAQELIAHITRELMAHHASDITKYAGGVRHLEKLCQEDGYQTISVSDAARMLTDAEGATDSNGGLTRKGEQTLVREMGSPLWLVDFPVTSVPFYQAWTPDGQHALAADLLFPNGEVLGAGQRHSASADLMRALQQQKVEKEPYDWYVRLRDERPLVTSGFGLGLERFLMHVLQHDDIRDIQVLPRLKGHPSAI